MRNISYEIINISNTVIIYNVSFDGFMSYDPPCFKCLVKGMCIEDIISSSYYTNIKVNVCEKLNKFLKGDRIFNNVRG